MPASTFQIEAGLPTRKCLWCGTDVDDWRWYYVPEASRIVHAVPCWWPYLQASTLTATEAQLLSREGVIG